MTCFQGPRPLPFTGDRTSELTQEFWLSQSGARPQQTGTQKAASSKPSQAQPCLRSAQLGPAHALLHWNPDCRATARLTVPVGLGGPGHVCGRPCTRPPCRPYSVSHPADLTVCHLCDLAFPLPHLLECILRHIKCTHVYSSRCIVGPCPSAL